MRSTAPSWLTDALNITYSGFKQSRRRTQCHHHSSINRDVEFVHSHD